MSSTSFGDLDKRLSQILGLFWRIVQKYLGITHFDCDVISLRFFQLFIIGNIFHQHQTEVRLTDNVQKMNSFIETLFWNKYPWRHRVNDPQFPFLQPSCETVFLFHQMRKNCLIRLFLEPQDMKESRKREDISLMKYFVLKKTAFVIVRVARRSEIKFNVAGELGN